MLEYINQLRARGHSIEESAVEGAVLRLRPIMMTMLVATLGLLPAAMSHGIGSDSQRPFAIVIVGGLIADLVMSIFLLPTLYVWVRGYPTMCCPSRKRRLSENLLTFLDAFIVGLHFLRGDKVVRPGSVHHRSIYNATGPRLCRSS